jgi:hypothetical protein
MFISHKKNWMHEIQSNIDIPHTGYYYPTPNGGRFTYYTDGKAKYIHITTQLEQAELLKKHGLIYHFEKKPFKMFVMNLLPSIGNHGEPAHTERPVEVKWTDFFFTPGQVLRFAASHEFERVSREIGLTGQVVSMFKNVIKAA